MAVGKKGTVWFYNIIVCPKKANSVDPDQTDPLGAV